MGIINDISSEFFQIYMAVVDFLLYPIKTVEKGLQAKRQGDVEDERKYWMQLEEVHATKIMQNQRQPKLSRRCWI